MVDPIQVTQTTDGELVLQNLAAAERPPLTERAPVRLPARVMRIWIAPWQDHAGDFIAAAHLYTEVEPARWLHATQPLPDPPSLQRLDKQAPDISPTKPKAAQ